MNTRVQLLSVGLLLGLALSPAWGQRQGHEAVGVQGHQPSGQPRADASDIPVALAPEKTLENFIVGITLYVDQPVRVGSILSLRWDGRDRRGGRAAVDAGAYARPHRGHRSERGVFELADRELREARSDLVPSDDSLALRDDPRPEPLYPGRGTPNALCAPEGRPGVSPHPVGWLRRLLADPRRRLAASRPSGSSMMRVSAWISFAKLIASRSPTSRNASIGSSGADTVRTSSHAGCEATHALTLPGVPSSCNSPKTACGIMTRAYKWQSTSIWPMRTR